MKLSDYQPFDIQEINKIYIYTYKNYKISIKRNIINFFTIIIEKNGKIITKIENIGRFSNSYIYKIVKRAIGNIEKE